MILSSESPAEPRLAVQAYGRLLDLIMSGQLKPGTMLQERRLAEQLNMSRTPLRDALLMLEHDGLIARLGRSGAQIRHLDVESYIDTLAIRRLLEPEAARIAAGRIAPPLLEDLRQRFAALRAAAAAKPDRAQVRALDDDLHSAIADAAGNRQMAAMIRFLRRQTLIFDLRSMPERLEDTCREHLALVAALAEGRGTAAAEAMRIHLDGVRRSIVQRLARGP